MKKKGIVIAACVVLLCIIVIALVIGGGKKPYKDLDATQIMAATVHLSPPDKTIQIVDIEELAEYLKEVVIRNEDNSYTEYAGQGVTFRLTMTDGTQTEIMAYNPFLVIDGVGYRTEYEPCEVLNNYANKLLNETDTVSFHDKIFNKSDLSKETLEWLIWYNSLSEEEQLCISFIPSDLYTYDGTGTVETIATDN